jgi:hypothetical protein
MFGGVFVAVFSGRLDLTQDSLEFVDLKDKSNDVRDTLSVACLDYVEAPAFPDAVSLSRLLLRPVLSNGVEHDAARQQLRQNVANRIGRIASKLTKLCIADSLQHQDDERGKDDCRSVA